MHTYAPGDISEGLLNNNGQIGSRNSREYDLLGSKILQRYLKRAKNPEQL